jgi:predicted metal-binding protein
MVRIGILTCANTTQELVCCSCLCLHDLNAREGYFSRHNAKGGAELVGIISCAGCPTWVAPEKIVHRVPSLIDTGLDAIHISNCLMTLCPFRERYVRIIEEHFPAIDIVLGTHGGPDEETDEMFQGVVREMLCQKRRSLADLVRPLHDMVDGTTSPSPCPKECEPNSCVSTVEENVSAEAGGHSA